MKGVRGVLTAIAVSGIVAIAGAVSSAPPQPPADDTKGWTLPPDAGKEQNPIAESPEIVQKGERVYRSRCQRCHGREGKGNGPDADPDKPAGNLTDRVRAAFNPDGVVFYKVWNGRQSPKMPAFKTEMSKDEVWTVIHYMKTLRK
jgi:mono/diheme cytochrome c family protein